MNSYQFNKEIPENFDSNISKKKYDKLNKYNKPLTLKIFHKIFDYLNFSTIFLIFILSFLSFNSQRKWTTIYTSLLETRNINNNLVDYISKTEEKYLNQFEFQNTYKNATSKDLIYLPKPKKQLKSNLFVLNIKSIINGLKDSQFQKGY
tara:strand:+ start:457 stop:903 length:447 start_codon:yes stop_codon:yes gene_type:complete